MIDKKNSFKVPPGYFNDLSEHIISHLPEKEVKDVPVISLWEKVKPWTYMAAMFAGIALMVRIFVGPVSQDGILAEQSNVSVDDIETFYSYYEDQYVDTEYHEEMYSYDDYEIYN